MHYLKKKNYIIIFRCGSAIGDHVYMSSIIKKIYDLKKKKILLFTNYYDFYLNNDRIYKLFKFRQISLIWFFLRNLKGEAIFEFESESTKKDKNKHFMYYHKKNIHIAQAMSEHFNINFKYDNLKNEIFLTQSEKNNYEKELKLPSKFSLIHSTSKKSFTTNKERRVEGMQAIVNNFNDLNWIQIGVSGEPILNNCLQLFDLNFRKLAYVISRCEFLVSYEGLFNHLASCFEKRNFLIHIGFLPVDSFYYKNNIVIEKNERLNCYPCYDLHCKNHKDLANFYITDDFVIETIKNNIN